jgi:hypothetical protein
MDTKTDSKQVMAGRALLLQNVRFQKTGKLSKRYGFVQLSDTINGGNLSSYTVNAIASDEDKIAAITSNGVYTLFNQENAWKKVSEFKNAISVDSEFFSKSSFQEIGPDADFQNNIFASICYKVGDPFSEPYQASLIYEDYVSNTRKEKSLAIFLSDVIAKRNNARVFVVGTSTNPSFFVFIPQSSSGGNGFQVNIYDKDLTLTANTVVGALNFDNAGFAACRNGSFVYVVTMTGTSMVVYKFSLATGASPFSTTTYTATGGSFLVSGSPCGIDMYATANHVVIAYIDGNGATAGQTSLVSFNSSLALVMARKTICDMVKQRKVSLICDASYAYVISEATEEPYPAFATKKAIAVEMNRVSYTTSAIPDNTYIIYRPKILCKPIFINSIPYAIIHLQEENQHNGYVVEFLTGYVKQKFSINGTFAQDLFTLPNFQVSNSPQVSTSIASIFYPSVYTVAVREVTEAPLNFVGTKRTFVNQASDSGMKTKLGSSIYYNSGSLFEFDGRGFYENGFWQSPPAVIAETITSAFPTPAVASKTFSYVAIYEYFDANGQLSFSAPSPIVTIGPTSASTESIQIYVNCPFGSLKINSDNYSGVMITLFRTTNNGATFFKLQSNGYFISNDGRLIRLDDVAADADIVDNQLLYTQGGILQNDQAPSSKFMVSGGNRIFLGGLEEKDEVAYSKKQLFSESIFFSDFFRIRIASGTNSDKTKISALGYMDGKLIVFREESIYFIQGDGPTETGLPVNGFSEPEIIQSDVGCSDSKSVISMPDGLMFKSKKGIYLLSRSMQVSYIGAAIEDFNSEAIIASMLAPKFNEVRFYTSGMNCLTYNYLFQVWSVSTGQTSVDAETYRNTVSIIKSNKIFSESESVFKDGTSFYVMKFISPWLKVNLVQGYVRAYQLWIIGDYKSAHTLKCKVYFDYDDTVFEEYSLVYDSSSSPQYQFTISLPRQKVESMKFEIFDADHAGTGESYDLSNIQIELGIKAGGYKLAPNKSY